MSRAYDVRLEKLFTAISLNDVPYVEECFKERKDGRNRFHVDARDADLNTPLLIAVFNDRLQIAHFLLERKASVNQGNMLGITPIMVACSTGSLRMVHLLVKYGATFGVSDLGQTCLGFACAHGHLDVVKYLIALGHELTPTYDAICPSHLMMATMYGHDEVIIYLCLSSLKDSNRLARLPEDAHENVNELLIETDNLIPAVDIDAPCPTFFNINVLTFAVVLHKRRIFEVLLELGADIDYRLPTGNTVARIAQLYDFDLREFGFADSASSTSMSHMSMGLTTSSSSSSMGSTLKRSRWSKTKLDKSDGSLKHIKAFVTNLFRSRK